MPMPVTARSQAWAAAARWWDCEFESHRGAWMFVVSAVCCQVEVSASGWSLVQGSRMKCGVAECDRGASITKPLVTRGMWEGRGQYDSLAPHELTRHYLPYFKSHILSQWTQRSYSLFVVMCCFGACVFTVSYERGKSLTSCDTRL